MATATEAAHAAEALDCMLHDAAVARALAALEAHANTLARLANEAGSARAWTLMASLNEVLSATERQIEMIR